MKQSNKVFVYTFSGSGESTYSVKWMPNSPNTLVAGATKWIRLFDIRSITLFFFKAGRFFEMYILFIIMKKLYRVS